MSRRSVSGRVVFIMLDKDFPIVSFKLSTSVNAKARTWLVSNGDTLEGKSCRFEENTQLICRVDVSWFSQPIVEIHNAIVQSHYGFRVNNEIISHSLTLYWKNTPDNFEELRLGPDWMKLTRSSKLIKYSGQRSNNWLIIHILWQSKPSIQCRSIDRAVRLHTHNTTGGILQIFDRVNEISSILQISYLKTMLRQPMTTTVESLDYFISKKRAEIVIYKL